MVARHASPLEALLVDERFDGEINPFEPMSRHTTYRIGGPARYFARVHSVGALARVLEACKAVGEKWYIVGRGSNLLVADEGVDAAVIVLGRDFRSMRYDEEKSRLMLGAGVPLSAAVQEAFRRSLAGLKGSAVGGARISDVHANFIVNTGNATARDVLSLIELVQGKVLEAYGVALKPEVKLLGFE